VTVLFHSVHEFSLSTGFPSSTYQKFLDQSESEKNKFENKNQRKGETTTPCIQNNRQIEKGFTPMA
jgi:hypothetical protein